MSSFKSVTSYLSGLSAFRGKHIASLRTSPPISPHCCVRPETDIIYHTSSFSDAGIIRLVNSNMFQPTADMAEIVQVNVIGVINTCAAATVSLQGGLSASTGRADRPAKN